jgi:hypothetical protein
MMSPYLFDLVPRAWNVIAQRRRDQAAEQECERKKNGVRRTKEGKLETVKHLL